VYTGAIGIAKMGIPNHEHFSMNLSLRRFAQRLIAYETLGGKPFEAKASAAGHPAVLSAVYEKLRGPLATLTGAAGFRALVSRALKEGKEEVSWLGSLQINADGFLEFPEETAQLDDKEIREGEIVFISELLGLLITFIGATVTLYLVQGVWSEASIEDMES